MTRPTLVLAFALALLLPLHAQDRGEPSPKEPTIEESAKALVESYVALLKAKKTKDAFKLWSFSRLCQVMFTQDFDAMSKEDQASCAKELSDLLFKSMSHPKVVEHMSKADYGALKVKQAVKGRVEVSFTLTPAGEGEKPVTQFLWVEKVGKRPCLMEMANGSPKLRIALQLGPRWKQAKAKGVSTPLAYMRVMAGKR